MGKNLLISLILIAPANTKDIHIAIDDNNSSIGTTGNPLKTLNAACNTLRKSYMLGKEYCRVIIHEEMDRFSKPFILNTNDSGNEEAEVHAIHKTLCKNIHDELTGQKENGELDFIGGRQYNRIDNISAVHKRFEMFKNVFEEPDVSGERFLTKQKVRLIINPEK